MEEIRFDPIERKEFFLAKLGGQEVTPPDAVTRIERYLQDIIDGNASTIPPITRMEYYLAKISGADVAIPDPVTRTECYLASIAGMEVDVPDPITREEYFLAEWAENSSEHTYGPAEIVSFETTKAKLMKSLLIALQPIQSGTPWTGTDYDQKPYTFRAVSDSSVANVGNAEMGSIVGGTVAWNQMVSNGNFASTTGWSAGGSTTLSASNNVITAVSSNGAGYFGFYQNNGAKAITGHKYFLHIEGKTSAADLDVYTPYYDTDSITNAITHSAIGTAWTTFERIVQGKADAYIKMGIRKGSGAYGSEATIYGRNAYIVDLTQMFGSTIADYLYTLESGTAGAGVAKLKEWGFFTKGYYAYGAGSLQSVNTSAHKTYKADSTLLGNYALDSSLTLRGIPKLDANNNLYYDGDVYEADGTVTRKYATRAYAEGDATDGSTMITDGTNTVYKLNTPTTESADPYTATQSIDPDGTEEYVDYAESQGTRDVAIPVGHYTNYANSCPITGFTGANIYVSPTQDEADANVYPADWTSEGTVYAGSIDIVSGEGTKKPYYSSYNGEALVGPWVSSMDTYTEGATPTTGAQVVDLGGADTDFSITGQEVAALVGQNYVWSDAGDVTVKV